jgi:uncharacterized protein
MSYRQESGYRLSAFALTLLMVAASVRADPLLTFPLRINSHEIRVEVANTEESMRKGLMFRDRLAENSGMIFVYAKPGIQAMWMKNTRIPLSVAFADADGRILNIEDMEPLSEKPHRSKGPAAYALEMNRGWFSKRGIGQGDRIEGLGRLPQPE